MLNLHEWALQYAAWGIPVFPCAINGKEPATPRSFDDASLDPDRINWWWREGRQHNIGCSPGAIGRHVLDFDVKGGGLETVEELDMLFGLSPIRVRTPSGGLHVWYKGHAPNFVRHHSFKGMDVRGDRGYVLLPPSIIDGKEYAWI